MNIVSMALAKNVNIFDQFSHNWFSSRLEEKFRALNSAIKLYRWMEIAKKRKTIQGKYFITMEY